MTGGFNLDKTSQHFAVGDVIPAGTLAIKNEETRLVQVIKTARVAEIDGDDAKVVTLHVDEFYSPCFAVGDKVLKAGAISGTLEEAPSITAISKKATSYVVTLSAEIAGLAVGDTIVEVVDDETNAAERGKANSVTICDVEVSEFETAVDVSADTMQYALYERRVPPIPESQKDATGDYLAGNVHVKLTKSY